MTSGRVVYDPFGRAVKVYHPTVDSERVDSFSRAVDNVPPTRTEYDELDRPLKVTLPDYTYTTYAYSLVGNALKTTVTDAEGNSSATLVNGSGKTVQSIQYKGGPDSEALTTTFAYDGIGRLVSVTDTEGNVRAVIDRNRNIVERNEYYPYGGLINASNSQLQPYKYSSKELDRENGLDLYDSQARWFDPMLPLTTTQDPLAEKYYSISPYTWCAGNPVKYFDPNSLDWVMGNKDQSIKWFDNVMSSKQTPIGYKYIGKSDNDILSMLYLNINFSNIVSNNIGYIAQDINVGFNMANIKEESIAFITADITRDATRS